MFRPPSDMSGAAPIEPLALDPGIASTEQDVFFGGGRRPATGHSNRRRWTALAVAIGVVATTVFVFGGRHPRTKGAAPTTTVHPVLDPTAPSPARANPTSALGSASSSGSVSSGSVSSGSVSSGSAAPVPVGPIDGSEPGVGLFVLDYAPGSLLTRFDLISGATQTVAVPAHAGAANSVLGIVGAGASAQAFTPADLGSDDWASCVDGTVWMRAPDGPVSLKELRHLRLHPGLSPEVLASVLMTAAIDQMKPGSMGTTADCRPVLTGPDGRGYVVDPSTGRLSKWSNGLLVTVQHGSLAEVVCSETGTCGLTLQGAAGQRVTLPTGGFYSQVSFSHDGLHALAIPSADQGAFAYVHGELLLVDLVSGQVTSLVSKDDAKTDPASLIGGIRSPAWAQWSPNDTFAVLSTGDRLVKVDVASKTVTSFATATGIDRGAQILAIA